MSESELFGEKLQRMLDLLDARLNRLQTNQLHREELLAQRIQQLEQSQTDQETRLRVLSDAIIRLNTQSSLAAVGQSMLSLILAAIAAYIGARR